LPSAQRLEGISPAAGHLAHMPSHIYMLVGDYERVVTANHAAAQTDHSYIEHGQVKGVYPMLYYHHNLHFIAAGSAMLGRYKDANDAAGRLAASLSAHASDIPEMQTFVTEYFGPYPLFVAARFGDWPAVLSTPRPKDGLPISNGLWRYARGVALSATGDAPKAEAERAELVTIRETLSEGSVYGLNAGTDVLGVALSLLDARIAAAKGDRKTAIRHLEASVMAQDKLAYNEPADWYYPVRETLGAMLLLDGQAAKAEEVFRADLLKTRRNGRSLFGLWQALAAQGKTTDAEFVRAQFDNAWHSAEIELRIEEM
jgi:tetratricopeptide (TPR) repeat protein